MRNLLLLVLLVLFAVPAKADPCDRKEWHVRIRSILVRLFPYDETAKNIRLIFVCDSRPGAAYVGSGLVINSGLLAFNKAELAAVVAHEMGHAELNQDPSEGLFGEDLVQLEKNEVEADDFSLVALRRAGYGPCDAYRAMAKALPFTSVLRNPTGRYNRIIVHRFGRLQEACKQGARP